MIQALQYEPQEQQNSKQQDRHIHLHMHLYLTFRASQGRGTHPHVISLSRILAALLAATMMPLGIFLYAMAIAPDGPPPTALENLLWVSGCVSVVAGLALAWCAVGALLCQAWRASPHGRFGLVLSLLLPLLIPLAAACYWFAPHGVIPVFLNMLLAIPLLVVLIAHPLITALLFERVSRETSALQKVSPTHSKLGFVVVAGMVLVLLGGLLMNLSFMLSGGIALLLFLPAIPIAIIVAIGTSARLFRSRESMRAQPKDASPSDVDSPGES